jgi:AraC-like DNA-binding protein
MAQLLVRKKRTVHLLFAIFCGSLAMLAAKQLGGEQLGAYQYLIGMGASATCNGYWLVSRALFREKDAIDTRHIVTAAGLGLLLITGQGIDMLQSMLANELVVLQSSRIALFELINLFSSCLLMLTAWEGFRGLRHAQGGQLWQRVLFLASYCLAVLSCTILVNLATTAEASNELCKILSPVFAIFIMLVTQVLIVWRYPYKPTPAEIDAPSETISPNNHALVREDPHSNNEVDQALVQQIQELLVQQDMYLQTKLKVADLARKMEVSEYRISQVVRGHFKARNFNQLINEMRIAHAKTLLADPQNTHWPILVVGMESGFASVGPFTRAFKSICDMTPNQYRQFHQSCNKKTLSTATVD